MYVVTDAYITAMKQPVQFSRMTGTIDDTIKFDDSNIIKDSFSMTNQCSDGDYVQIGTVYVGELTCTFIGIDDIDRNDWAGRVIKPVYQQRLGDGTYFDIKLGVFTVASAEWSENGITITAYDNMQKFDIEYPINNSTGGRATNTPWWWLNGLCYACEMELANTWEEIVAFQNGEEQLTLYTTDNVYTYRDLLHWLTQAMGCFATIDRDGKLILKTYGDEPIDTIDRAHRFKGGEFADFNTRYETVELFDLIKGDWQVFKSEYWGNGLTYSLYDNPFLQTEDDTTRNHWLSNIYNVLYKINYVPFKVSMIGNPMYWLGDVIKFTDGIAGTESLCCITKFTFNYHKEYIMEGAGQNPNYSLKSGTVGMQRGYDSMPTEGSTRAVSSDGIYRAINTINESIQGLSGGNGNGVGKSVDGVLIFIKYKNAAGNKTDYAIGNKGAEIFNSYTGNYRNRAYAEYSHAEGYDTQAIAKHSHAEGSGTSTFGDYSHAEGLGTKTGYNPIADESIGAHAEGVRTTAAAYATHAEGADTIASGSYSHAEGFETTASGGASHAGGMYTIAGGTCETAIGMANKASSDTYFYIGNGFSTSNRSNAFRVTEYGAVYGMSAFNSSGADYAEYFEWLDGNPDEEDRAGYFVTLQDKKIAKAKSGDYILGVVSGQPCIIGNADEDWLGRWEHDEFNRFIKEDVESPVFDEEGNETGKVTHGWRYKANPEYDNTQVYIERKDRKEWDAVGMVGVLSVRDDGTCEVNGYAAVTDEGTATKSDRHIAEQTYRVVRRITPNVVEVIFR